MAEPIKTPFWMLTYVGQRNHVLDEWIWASPVWYDWMICAQQQCRLSLPLLYQLLYSPHRRVGVHWCAQLGLQAQWQWLFSVVWMRWLDIASPTYHCQNLSHEALKSGMLSGKSHKMLWMVTLFATMPGVVHLTSWRSSGAFLWLVSCLQQLRLFRTLSLWWYTTHALHKQLAGTYYFVGKLSKYVWLKSEVCMATASQWIHEDEKRR